MVKLSLVLIVIIGWLQYSLWLGKNGAHDYWQIKEKVVADKVNNNTLKERNTQLFAEIHDLQKGHEAIEERARGELDMIKPGETYYRIINETSKSTKQHQ